MERSKEATLERIAYMLERLVAAMEDHVAENIVARDRAVVALEKLAAGPAARKLHAQPRRVTTSRLVKGRHMVAVVELLKQQTGRAKWLPYEQLVEKLVAQEPTPGPHERDTRRQVVTRAIARLLERKILLRDHDRIVLPQWEEPRDDGSDLI